MMSSGDMVYNAIVFGLPLIIVVVALYYFMGNKKGLNDFKPVPFSHTVCDNLKQMVSSHGISCDWMFGFLFGTGAKLKIGYQTVCDIDSYTEVEGSFPTMVYNRDTKQLDYKEGHDKKFSLVILQAKSKSMLWRLLGMKKQYYVINKDRIVFFDPVSFIWQLKHGEYMIPYGDTWVNSDTSMEFCDDLSIKQSKESMMTHMQNFPDRVIHLEVLTARKNQLMQASAIAEKERWDKAKHVDDTVIT